MMMLMPTVAMQQVGNNVGRNECMIKKTYHLIDDFSDGLNEVPDPLSVGLQVDGTA